LGINKVLATGGTPSLVTALDKSRERGHGFPSFLPDGKHFLYYAEKLSLEKSGTYIGSLDAKSDTQTSKQLVAGESSSIFAPSTDSDTGYLLFRRENTLLAQHFDTNRLDVVGEPVSVGIQGVNFLYLPAFSASANGVLVYSAGSGNLKNQPTWFDRQGKI